ncbi:hypothetical protein [Methanosphaerula palustris]|uniref:hypothetical protein n=1 Tax=Methanosphaerula palustris TaxID=475088 RepID=UPI00018486C1|nr:hypothetical protein [Methanosphaerula palustris]
MTYVISEEKNRAMRGFLRIELVFSTGVIPRSAISCFVHWKVVNVSTESKSNHFKTL